MSRDQDIEVSHEFDWSFVARVPIFIVPWTHRLLSLLLSHSYVDYFRRFRGFENSNTSVQIANSK